MEENRAIAMNLLEHVMGNDVACIEKITGGTDTRKFPWRGIIRYEFHIPDIMEDILRYEILLPRLLAYEINTTSPLHLAAMKGHDDILINFIDHDVPIDLMLASGTTCLHLAAFGGQLETVRMLVDVYHVELDKQDRYGWTALHYASSEGHFAVVQMLTRYGINVNLRDKDGTSAAFRAECNRHTDIVHFLCELGDADELLNVPGYEDVSRNRASMMREDVYEDPLYSTVDFAQKCKARAAPDSAKRPEADRSVSSRPLSDTYQYASVDGDHDNKRQSLRRLIRQELQDVFTPPKEDGSHYMTPKDVDQHKKAKASRDIFGLTGDKDVGISTLKGIMREEFERYKNEHQARMMTTDMSLSQNTPRPISVAGNDYDDIYEIIDRSPPPLVPAPAPPLGTKRELEGFNIAVKEKPDVSCPELPPRNPATKPDDIPQFHFQDPFENSNIEPEAETLKFSETLMVEGLSRIMPTIANDWKRLAHALPLESTPARVNKRIAVIEGSYPYDKEKQAEILLGEWKINEGQAACLDALIVALRKCNLKTVIDDIDILTSEFTA